MEKYNKSYVSDLNITAKTKLVSKWGGCEHVRAHKEHLHAVYYQMDVVNVNNHCLCYRCMIDMDARLDNRVIIGLDNENIKELMVFCYDCRKDVSARKASTWTPYDYSELKGDRPIHVCCKCLENPLHLRRVTMDAANCEADQQSIRAHLHLQQLRIRALARSL